MNPSNSVVKKVDGRFTSLIWLAVVIGAGAAAMAFFPHGGSTATIEQSGGRGTSHSQVIRDKEGQTLIMQDRNSTDITVQRHSGVASLDTGSESPTPKGREDFKQQMLERLHRSAP